MKYAIIAAGEGSRLSEEGIKDPKPLIKVDGEPLVDRLIRIFMENDATEIVIICNDMTTLVSEHLREIQRDGVNGTPVRLRVIVKSTPSSMHSFFEISDYLKDEPFCLTTVDTIFNTDEFKKYIEDDFEMPDKVIAALIRFLEQNNGKLSKRAKEKEFTALSDIEVQIIEEQYKRIFLL